MHAFIERLIAWFFRGWVVVAAILALILVLISTDHPISWLNQNQGAVIAILTLALVLTTVYYADKTRALVEESRNAYMN